MILILLQRFCEKHESVPGYHLCRKLVADGNNLYVTTTSSGEELKSEMRDAQEITEQARGKGGIILLALQGGDSSEHSGRIPSLNKRHFDYLFTSANTETIIGLLPGTAEFAAELKNTLNSKLVLFATECKTPDQVQRVILPQSDEVWCLGPKAHIHYKRLCQGISSDCAQRCKEILLKPHVRGRYDTHGKFCRKVVSIWSFYPDSKAKEFQELCLALRRLSANAKTTHEPELEWLVHGLKDQSQIVKSVLRHGKQNEPKFSALAAVSSLDEIIGAHKDIFALIVPDAEDDYFNFIALSAMWLGIPTIVSSQSAIGHLLLGLPCPSKDRSVIHLTRQ